MRSKLSLPTSAVTSRERIERVHGSNPAPIFPPPQISPTDPISATILSEFTHIAGDLWNILTLINRLEWMHSAAIDGGLDREHWFSWPAMDIEHFHIELRSVFDYLARMFGAAAAQPGSVPQSFREMTEWLSKNKANRRRLGEDLAELVLDAPRFPSIRGVRDATVHRGGQTMVFAKPEDGILFQVNQNWRRLVSESGAMYNENVVDFRRYANRVLIDVYLFVDRSASVLRRLVGSLEPSLRARDYHPGYSTLIRWLQLEPGVHPRPRCPRLPEVRSTS